MEAVSQVCWVTGARGFIGRRVAKKLSQQGFRVLGVGHGSWPESEAKKWGVDVWLDGELSAANFNYLRSREGLPAFIFHLAGGSSVGVAYQNPLEDFNRTVRSAAELLEWIRQESPRSKVIMASSAAVYGNNYSGLIKETFATMPYSIYGYNKLAMENLCRSYGFNYGIESSIARIFSVYGKGLKKQLMWDICSKLSKDSTLLKLGGNGEECRDWIHVDDTVEAFLALRNVSSSSAPAFNLATGIGTSVRSIAECMMSAWNNGDSNSKYEILFDGQQRKGDPFSLIAEISNFKELENLPSRNLKEEIFAFVNWFKSLND